ncbi:MAG: extracellular solute-binding protein, partial [Firmicutes bacterium]|nr:extracellular solute-binding protein [Bacillota bacterium]
VLVIASIDGDSLGTVLAQAKEKNIPVIAYDRLIMNSDAVSYYATFDNWLVGTKQGEFIEEQLGLKDGKGPFNIEFITGDPGDNNINFFFDGAMSILQKYLDNGQLVCPSGQTEKAVVATANWATDAAQARFENILSSYYADKDLDAVLASNDSTACGVENALASSYSGKWPVITGQDCDIAIMGNLIAGKQGMSVFKDTRTLAAKVVEMVDALMKGQEPPINDTETYNNGVGVVPSFLCEPVACTVDNYKELLIDSGYYTLAQLGIDEGAAPAAAAKAPEDYTGTLTVYSPHDSDPLNAGVAAFEAAYPNVKVEVIADGTSNLVNKIGAESANPIADVLWGGGADTLAAYKDYFQPYKPSCIDLIDPSLVDAEYYWIGESPLPMVFIANTDKIPEEDIPTTWAALADFDTAKYGKIAIADPTSSGSAFTQLCTMLFLFGDESDDYAAGWEFVDKIIDKLEVKNSSSLAHKDIYAGENAVGITLEKAAIKYTEPNMVVVFPTDGTSAVPDGVAIVKNCPNLELAQLFVEFVLGHDCQVAQNADWGRRPIRSDVEPVGLKPLSEITLMNYNFDYAANNAADIKEMWQDKLVG